MKLNQFLFYQIIGAFANVGLLWMGAEYYLSTTEGQIQQVRWELVTASELTTDEDHEPALSAAIAFVKDGDRL